MSNAAPGEVRQRAGDGERESGRAGDGERLMDGGDRGGVG